MKAIVQDHFGSADALQLREIEKPKVPDDGVLVRVHAAAVNPADWHIMRGEPYIARPAFGLRGPREPIRGTDVSGQVEAVGKNVGQLRPGDEVFGWCQAALAEYICAGEDRFAPKPAGTTFEQAAAVPLAGLTALQALRDIGEIQPGQKVLINGAAGGVGTFAVQIAASLGADVTGVCSTKHVDMVRSIGAHHVIDYTQADFTRGGQPYDLILDNAGNHSLTDCRRALTPNGRLITNSGAGGRWIGPVGRLAKARITSPFLSRKAVPVPATYTHGDLVVLKDLVEAGKVTVVIDRTYSLSETAEAIRYLEEGHAGGKIVISV